MIQHDANQSETEQEQDSLLLATVLQGTQHLTDAQLLSTLLRDLDIIRAEAILRSGNLNALIHGGPMELMAHGLHEEEVLRIMTHLELTSRVIAQRRLHRLASLDDTVREIRIRGEQRERTCVGIFAVDSRNRILMDKVLFEGGPESCSVDVAEILRLAYIAYSRARHRLIVLERAIPEPIRPKPAATGNRTTPPALPPLPAKPEVRSFTREHHAALMGALTAAKTFIAPRNG